MNKRQGGLTAPYAEIFAAWKKEFESGSKVSCQGELTGTDIFSHPVRHLVDQCADEVFAWIIGSDEVDALPKSLAEWCHLRAVQEINLDNALMPFISLKRIAREVVSKGTTKTQLSQFDLRLDEVVTRATLYYKQSRTRLMRIRDAEIQRSEGFMKRRRLRPHAQQKGEML